VARLGNPANDAGLVAETFKSADFDRVELRRDLKINEMRRALRDFVDRARDADVAVVYYAGPRHRARRHQLPDPGRRGSGPRHRHP
jgi:uncharacterized caspase-like protein